jgi:hypothetical protein
MRDKERAQNIPPFECTKQTDTKRRHREGEGLIIVIRARMVPGYTYMSKYLNVCRMDCWRNLFVFSLHTWPCIWWYLVPFSFVRSGQQQKAVQLRSAALGIAVIYHFKIYQLVVIKVW